MMQVLLDVVKKVGASKVYCQGEATYEEAQVERRVASALRAENAQLKTSWSSTLFDIDALSFKLAELPSTHGVQPQCTPKSCLYLSPTSIRLQYLTLPVFGSQVCGPDAPSTVS